MKRRYLIPEVVQTSAMDCGPACLKALFAGFGLYLSYGRLREACQTDVDGTSIDTLEELAGQLGLGMQQAMVPGDWLLLPQAARLPAIIVVTLADGSTHFVVAWRLQGDWVQVMDPGVGRLWMRRQRFLEWVYQHEHAVPAEAWHEWTRSAEFTASIQQRCAALGVPPGLWTDPAHQDAALRLAGALHAAGQLHRGAEAAQLLALCATEAQQIPPRFWAVARDGADPTQVVLRGAVLLMVNGATDSADPAGLPAALARVRTERATSLWDPLWRALRASGWRLPLAAATALGAAAAGSVLEALLFRGLFDMGRHLESGAARLAAAAAVAVFLVLLLCLEWPADLALWRLGRLLELRLRIEFLRKIPVLSDHYFQSRLLSDMARRAHSLRLLRQLPVNAGRLLQLLAGLLVTGAAIVALYPGSALLVTGAVLAACLVPALFVPATSERDLRQRELGGTLAALLLDALHGSRAIQAHGAQPTLRTVQDQLLRRWRAAGRGRMALFALAEGAQMAAGVGFVVALVYRQAALVESPAGLLLLVFWASSIPVLGQQAAAAARAVPAMRNTLLRFLEPLGAPEEDRGAADATAAPGGVRLRLESVSVRLAGTLVLEDINLDVAPGEHVAIVGTSGAGKSSLLGCLLGWHPPASGRISVDGAPLSGARLAQLRSELAWIDPQVHLFRRSLFENLRYGNSGDASAHLADAVTQAKLGGLLQHLPQGLQTDVGESGMRLSGGEGQRVRLGRALGRRKVRLAILDEPARGLGRGERRRMLGVARRQLAGATFLCVTHDIADTLDFDRVLVIEQGRIREDGCPQRLAAEGGSRYQALLAQEQAVGGALWQHPKWRRLQLRAGALRHSGTPRP